MLLLATALGLVALTNPLTIKLSLAGAGLAMIYPLMKRITHLPQIALGIAFSWSIPWHSRPASCSTQCTLVAAYCQFVVDSGL